MPALVEFQTVPQLFLGVSDRYAGRKRTVMSYKAKQTKAWTPITWEELRASVEAMAGYLHRRGVRPGDRVAILSENRPEWAITDLATQLIGGVNVSLYTSLPASQVAYILQDSGAKLFVVSTGIQLKKAEEVFGSCPELAEVVTMSELRKDHPDYVRSWDAAQEEGAAYWKAHRAELAPLAAQVKPTDLSALIYTSGTTGTPKGVMLTHDNFCSNARAALSMVPFDEQDHHLSFLPLCHSFERTAGYHCVLACGAQISYAESVDTVSKNLTEVHPTVLISVPLLFQRMYNLILKSVEEGSNAKKRIFNWALSAGKRAAAARRNGGPGAFLKAQQALADRLVFSKLHDKLGGRLRFAVSGGAALPKAVGEFFEAAGVTIIEGYGLTETSPVTNINPFTRPRYGTVGHVIPEVTIGIQSLQDGRILAQLSGNDYPSTLTSGEGEILVRGPNVMKGYWNREEDTRQAIDGDGWFHTGDVGRFENGYLVITDRIKHMIVSKGGKNIYPGPIEDRFKSFQYVDQIMIVGEGREYLSALVVPNPDALESYAKEQQIPYASREELYERPEIHQLFEREFRTYSRGAAAHEKVRGFRFIREPFTVDNGLLTPTLKPKRKAIEQRYAELIEGLYAEMV